jgi:hypothetical protein
MYFVNSPSQTVIMCGLKYISRQYGIYWNQLTKYYEMTQSKIQKPGCKHRMLNLIWIRLQ